MDSTSVQDSAKPVLLVVDDDHAIRTLLAQSLGMHGYQVETATNAQEMDGVLARRPVSLILLDVMMPGEDGLSVCRRLARVGAPPVVMLSALGDEPDRILGLEIGASHYLSKPCSPREILATVRAALRAREIQDAGESRSFGFLGWRVDFAAHELFDPDGTLIDLTDGEFTVGQVDQRAVRIEQFVRGEIDSPPEEAERSAFAGVLDLPRAERCTYGRQDLARAARLGKVMAGADFQSQDTIRFVAVST